MKNNGIYSRIREIYADDRGITGLETAIILIAFIVVAAVFAFTVMTTGLFSTEKAKTTAQAGIAEASSTFAPKGAIIATSNLTSVQTFQFQVTLATGAVAASITPADLAFIYSDKFQSQSSSGVVANSTAGILNAIAIGKIVGTPSNHDQSQRLLQKKLDIATIELIHCYRKLLSKLVLVDTNAHGYFFCTFINITAVINE